MFEDEVPDAHAVAVRRLATIGGQRRGGGAPGGRLRGRRARAARAVAAASAGVGPAGVMEVAAQLRSTEYGPLRAELPGLRPGPVLGGLLDQLDGELDTATEHALVDVIGGWQRQAGYGEAAQIAAIAKLAGRPMFAGCAEHGHDDPTHGVRGAASVVSAELRLSPAAAVARVATACELVHDLPATLAELRSGRIDGYRARVIAEQTRPLAGVPDLRRQVEATLLARAHRQTATQLRAAARKTVTGRGHASRADTPRPRPTTLLTRGSGNVTGSRG